MSSHRTLLMVALATLIFSAASMAADRLGPGSARAGKAAADAGSTQTAGSAGSPSKKGATPDGGGS